MAYPGDAVIVPVSIRNPLLRAPAAVFYTVESTTGEDPTEYIPEEALEGVLSWDQDVGRSLNLTLPVNWSSVPPEAEYRLSVKVEAAWQAEVEGPARGAIAVHLFGVQPGQCPPGSYRYTLFYILCSMPYLWKYSYGSLLVWCSSMYSEEPSMLRSLSRLAIAEVFNVKVPEQHFLGGSSFI